MTELSSFAELPLLPPILAAIEDCGYTKPTPIQAEAIVPLLEGKDLLGIAQTGTGKTAAFTLPMLQRFSEQPRARRPRAVRSLILTPTRELAAQIDQNIAEYGKKLKLRHTVIFGGVGQKKQVDALARGLDLLTATPGRLLDLMTQGHVTLDGVEVFVLDEADRMLDMGFIHDVRRVLKALPTKRQSVLFSATMPPDIVKLAHSFLNDPVRIEVTPQATTVERIDQRLMYVEKTHKRELLVEVLRDPDFSRTLVFTRTKHGANRAVEFLQKRGKIEAMAIHGNKSQGARERALESFRTGDIQVLVATDIAARGIDVPGISHVVNFDLPNVPESYVHRIGRTARAGRDGVAISFCAHEERPYLKSIERLIRMQIPVIHDHAYPSDVPLNARPAAPEKTGRHRRRRKA